MFSHTLKTSSAIFDAYLFQGKWFAILIKRLIKLVHKKAMKRDVTGAEAGARITLTRVSQRNFVHLGLLIIVNVIRFV